MLLLKNNLRLILAIFLSLANYWIVRILNENFWIAIVLILITLTIIFFYKNKLVLIISTLILLVLQIYTSNPVALTNLDNDQQRVQQERIRSYPLTYIDLGLKVIWLKPVEWIEENKYVIGLSRIEENIFSTLNINYYFFGGFPTNKPSDFDKFTFFYLPFFIIGILILVKKKNYAGLIFLFIIPVLIISFIGKDNRCGFICLFPFIVLAIYIGALKSIDKLKKLND